MICLNTDPVTWQKYDFNPWLCWKSGKVFFYRIVCTFQSCQPWGSTPFPQSELVSSSGSWKVLYLHQETLPVPSAWGKSTTAQEHQVKPCPAMGSEPTLPCTPVSPNSPQKALLCLRDSWLALATLRKCYTHMEQATQQISP